MHNANSCSIHNMSSKYTKTNQMNIENLDSGSYQIIVCNIHWDISTASKRTDELPSQLALDVPENVLNQAKKKSNDFNDIIEQFAYNLLSRKFNCEVCYCQVWLPVE